MNSLTWQARSGGARWVVKAVPPEAKDGFVFGLDLAHRLERAGIPAGAPVATESGLSVVPFGGQMVALLRWVDGRGLTGESHTELGVMGALLWLAPIARSACRTARAQHPPACISRRSTWMYAPGSDR